MNSEETTLGETPATPPAGVGPAHVPPVPVPTEKLAPAAWFGYLIGGLIFAGLVGAGLWYLGEFLLDRFEENSDWVRRVRWALLGLLALVALVQPLVGWFFWRFAMDDELLVVRYGILSREEKVIPISRMQHVDLRRGPIQRILGLTSFVVFTAGVGDATFALPGLRDQRARELRDAVLAQRGDDVI